jgi:adenine-specific DNA-methyltransferase
MSLRIPKSCKVYTPDDLAAAIVTAMGDTAGSTWLEPCFGKGAFLRALAQLRVSPERIVGVDLDTKCCEADHLATTLRGKEFLAWSLSTSRRFSRIVANPPFVSFRRLPARLHSVASQLNCQWAGSSSGNSNLWFAFLRASLSLLQKGGSIGFIVPAAFDYADYAAALREQIHRHFAEFEVHRCQKPLFKEVQDGCAVLIGHGYELQNLTNVRCEYRSSSELLRGIGRTVKCAEVVTSVDSTGENTVCVRLSDVMKIRIGCVTGDVAYFLLRESERIRLHLPVRVLQPVLTRARHLRTAFVTKRFWKKLKDCDERVWLFRPHKRHVHLSSVRRYLRLDPEKGGCKRSNFKIENRTVWYRPELPERVDGLLSGTSTLGPWISVNGYQKMSATNTLYCVTFNERLSREKQAAWALSLLTKDFRKQIATRIRFYPDGLRKIEPGDLLTVMLSPPPADSRGASNVYRQAIRALIERGREAAESVVEDWLRLRNAATNNHGRKSTSTR